MSGLGRASIVVATTQRDGCSLIVIATTIIRTAIVLVSGFPGCR